MKENEFFEIERKFLVKELPQNLEDYEKVEILQGYLSTEPVLRVRKENDLHYFTFKGDGIIKKVEFNHQISQKEFTNLWNKAEGGIIEKTRYKIPIHSDLVAELDIYKGHLKGFFNVEVEFKSLEQAKNFVAPSWFGEDISLDKKYSNASLANISIDEIYKK